MIAELSLEHCELPYRVALQQTPIDIALYRHAAVALFTSTPAFSVAEAAIASHHPARENCEDL
jgi:hypothetical protein